MLFIDSNKLEHFYTFYLKFVSETLLYIKNFILYISVWLIGYLCVCCVVYRRYARKLPTRTRGALGAKRVLLVIAHPDDECMFFGPTIFRLCEQGAEVYILCLSNGNYEGKGNQRRKELWEACKHLGVPDTNICLITDSRMLDSPKVQWPVPIIAKLIEHQLEALEIDTLVTFDRGGISSHPNHSAVFYAVAYLFVEMNMPQRCTVYTLDSVNILRKYLSFLDLPLSFVLSSKSLPDTCRIRKNTCTNFHHRHPINKHYTRSLSQTQQSFRSATEGSSGDRLHDKIICDKFLETLAVDAELVVIVNKEDNIVRNLDAQEIKATSICKFVLWISEKYFLRWTESRRVTRAMKRHKSQMVWFRYLYVIFSRYMVINTLRKINLADIELELEVDD